MKSDKFIHHKCLIQCNGYPVSEWQESPCKSGKKEEMVERQDKEGAAAAAMGEWGIFSHPAEKGRHAWTEEGELILESWHWVPESQFM